MKNLTLLLLIALLVSCSGDSVQTDSSGSDEVVVTTEEEDFYVPEDPISREFELSEMPKKWWLLSEEDDSFIIIDHWDAQDEYIEFRSGENGDWSLDILYPQDTDQGPIGNFQATIIEGEGIAKVEGSFTFSGYFEDEPREISFFWDQYTYYAEFENLFPVISYYVPDESKDFFPSEETVREED